jgi:hypothetical protein
LQCVKEEAGSRPTMSEIVKEIEEIMQIGGFKNNSNLGFREKINPTRRYSVDVSVKKRMDKICFLTIRHSCIFLAYKTT